MENFMTRCKICTLLLLLLLLTGCNQEQPPAAGQTTDKATSQQKAQTAGGHLSLGDTGAATLPLALALASARLDFRFPSVDNIFVCEVSRHSPRGVVYLKVPPTRKENNSL
jgi:hypothetical protein